MHCSRVVLLAETVVATTKIHQNNSSMPQYRTCPASSYLRPADLEFDDDLSLESHPIPSHSYYVLLHPYQVRISASRGTSNTHPTGISGNIHVS